MASSPTADDLEVVRQIDVFSGVKPLDFQRLVAPAVTLTFRAGDTVFLQGDPAMSLFMVVDGWIKLYHITSSGKEAVIHVFTRGESIAQAVAFTGQSYPAAAEAASEARIVRIPAAHIIKCIRDTPEIAIAMIASTSQHLHQLVEQVAQLKVQSAVQRVAEFLVSLCPAGKGPFTIALPYGKVLIAGRLGIKPESLSRAFAALRNAGIEVRDLKVIVRDVSVLRRVATGNRRARRDPQAAGD
ncbi:MAG: Crp/Fnr family transcriptional regulator [Xanthobacteraceae bacterium]|nr:MAG: Crp/Fnr family transcriptional regulator [Xanthobacteraceae bacterium]